MTRHNSDNIPTVIEGTYREPKAKKPGRRRGLIGLIVVATLFIKAGVYAFGPSRCSIPERFMGRIVGKLELTKAQKTSLRGIYLKAKADRAQNKAKMKKLSKELESIMTQANPDKAKLDAVVAKLFDNAKAIALSKTTYLLQAHKVLNPQQRQKAQQMMKKFKSKMHQRRNRCKRGPNYIPSFLR